MTLPPLRPGKHVSEACHRLSHINSRTDVTGVTELPCKTSKAALNGHLLPLRSPPRLWFAWSVFWWYPHPGWANDNKVLSEPAEHFIYLFFPYGDELLLTAQRLVQHIAKCKRSDRKWGLTLSRAGSHPSRGRPPVAVCNKAARLLLLAAVFHHWIAHRCCQNSRPCVQFVFFSLSLCILGYSGNGSACLGQWIGVHLVVCLSICHSNIFDTLLAPVW